MASHVVGDAGAGTAIGARTRATGGSGGGRQGYRSLAKEAAPRSSQKSGRWSTSLLDSYTADGYTAAVEELIRKTSTGRGTVPAYLSSARFRAEAGDAIFASIW